MSLTPQQYAQLMARYYVDPDAVANPFDDPGMNTLGQQQVPAHPPTRTSPLTEDQWYQRHAIRADQARMLRRHGGLPAEVPAAVRAQGAQAAADWLMANDPTYRDIQTDATARHFRNSQPAPEGTDWAGPGITGWTPPEDRPLPSYEAPPLPGQIPLAAYQPPTWQPPAVDMPHWDEIAAPTPGGIAALGRAAVGSLPQMLPPASLPAVALGGAPLMRQPPPPRPRRGPLQGELPPGMQPPQPAPNMTAQLPDYPGDVPPEPGSVSPEPGSVSPSQLQGELPPGMQQQPAPNMTAQLPDYPGDVPPAPAATRPAVTGPLQGTLPPGMQQQPAPNMTAQLPDYPGDVPPDPTLLRRPNYGNVPAAVANAGRAAMPGLLSAGGQITGAGLPVALGGAALNAAQTAAVEQPPSYGQPSHDPSQRYAKQIADFERLGTPAALQSAESLRRMQQNTPADYTAQGYSPDAVAGFNQYYQGQTSQAQHGRQQVQLNRQRDTIQAAQARANGGQMAGNSLSAAPTGNVYNPRSNGRNPQSRGYQPRLQPRQPAGVTSRHMDGLRAQARGQTPVRPQTSAFGPPIGGKAGVGSSASMPLQSGVTRKFSLDRVLAKMAASKQAFSWGEMGEKFRSLDPSAQTAIAGGALGTGLGALGGLVGEGEEDDASWGDVGRSALLGMGVGSLGGFAASEGARMYAMRKLRETPVVGGVAADLLPRDQQFQIPGGVYPHETAQQILGWQKPAADRGLLKRAWKLPKLKKMLPYVADEGQAGFFDVRAVPFLRRGVVPDRVLNLGERYKGPLMVSGTGRLLTDVGVPAAAIGATNYYLPEDTSLNSRLAASTGLALLAQPRMLGSMARSAGRVFTGKDHRALFDAALEPAKVPLKYKLGLGALAGGAAAVEHIPNLIERSTKVLGNVEESSRPVLVRDAQGNPVLDPVTGKPQTKSLMELADANLTRLTDTADKAVKETSQQAQQQMATSAVLDAQGNPVLDASGKPVQKSTADALLKAFEEVKTHFAGKPVFDPLTKKPVLNPDGTPLLRTSTESAVADLAKTLGDKFESASERMSKAMESAAGAASGAVNKYAPYAAIGIPTAMIGAYLLGKVLERKSEPAARKAPPAFAAGGGPGKPTRKSPRVTLKRPGMYTLDYLDEEEDEQAGLPKKTRAA
jgi:hypothetical protein